jgi:hypothetical protein
MGCCKKLLMHHSSQAGPLRMLFVRKGSMQTNLNHLAVIPPPPMLPLAVPHFWHEPVLVMLPRRASCW